MDKIKIDKATINLNQLDNRFENLKKIQSAFLNCYYRSENTNLFFENLTSDKKTDFSRYFYFHAKYMESLGNLSELKKNFRKSLEKHPEIF